MKEEKKENNVFNIRSTSKKPVDKEQLSQTFKRVHRLFVLGLKPGIVNFFNSLDDMLFNMAEKAENNEQQNSYFDAMRIIRKKKESLLKEFTTNVTHVFSLFAKRNYDYFPDQINKKSQNHNSLSLIEEEDLDLKLAGSQLVSKADTFHHQQIHALKIRFSVLAGGQKLESEQVPVSPFVIVNSFSQSIEKLQAPGNVKLIVIKLLERNLVGSLSEVYHEINNYLAEQGICPEIKFSSSYSNPNKAIPKKPGHIDNSTAEHNNAIQQNYASQEQHNSVNLASHQDYAAIMSMLNQRHVATPSSQTLNPMDYSEISQGIEQIKNQILHNINSENHTGMSPIQLKDLLLQKLQELDFEDSEKAVKEADQDTIDLVAMLFQFLVEDRNLPDKMQALLARLQLPFLHIALKDRKLFTNKEHPARQLLDDMAQSSIGWTEKLDRKNEYITHIENIVNTILKNEDQPLNYTELHRNFLEFNEKYNKKAHIIEKRTSEKISGQERVEVAKENTAKLLKSKLKGKSLPNLVRDLLLTPWANVLILAHLREADEPKQLKQFKIFIDYLINASIKNDKLKVNEELIERIIGVMNKGLKLVAYDEIGIQHKSNQIRQCLLTIHGLSDEAKPAEVEIVKPENILEVSNKDDEESEIMEYLKHTETEKNSQMVSAPDIEDEHMDAVKKLIKGDWVEFLYDEKGLKAKLSWISPISSRLLFVNSRGIKVTDKKPKELAHELREARARILQQIPLFDRALSAIAKQMEKDKEQADNDKKSEQPADTNNQSE